MCRRCGPPETRDPVPPIPERQRPPSQDVERAGSAVGVRGLCADGFLGATAPRASADALGANRSLTVIGGGRDRPGRRRALAL